MKERPRKASQHGALSTAGPLGMRSAATRSVGLGRGLNGGATNHLSRRRAHRAPRSIPQRATLPAESRAGHRKLESSKLRCPSTEVSLPVGLAEHSGSSCSRRQSIATAFACRDSGNSAARHVWLRLAVRWPSANSFGTGRLWSSNTGTIKRGRRCTCAAGTRMLGLTPVDHRPDCCRRLFDLRASCLVGAGWRWLGGERRDRRVDVLRRRRIVTSVKLCIVSQKYS